MENGKPAEIWDTHKSAIQAVTKLPSEELVSGSSDTTLKLQRGKTCVQTFVGHTDGVCLQSLEHPGCVWDAKFLENGDIVTACSDGVIQIWTVDQGSIADPLELEAYASELSQYKLSSYRLDHLRVASSYHFSTLPDIHLISSCCTWKSVDGLKLEDYLGLRLYRFQIGEVVESPDDSMKHTVLDGVKYDYAFDVYIGDGEPIRKLPYN